MQPNLQDVLIEWILTEPEQLVARQLTPLQVAWISTKYSQLFKKKASLAMPVTPDEQRAYFLEVARIDGRLDIYQELLDDHKAATHQMNAAKAAAEEAKMNEAKELQKRAANQVNKPN